MMKVQALLDALRRGTGSPNAWSTLALALGSGLAEASRSEVEELLDGVGRIGSNLEDLRILGSRECLLNVLSGHAQASARLEEQSFDDAALAATGERTKQVACWLKAHGPARHGRIAEGVRIDKGQLSKLLNEMVDARYVEDAELGDAEPQNARLCRLLPRGVRLATLYPVALPLPSTPPVVPEASDLQRLERLRRALARNALLKQNSHIEIEIVTPRRHPSVTPRPAPEIFFNYGAKRRIVRATKFSDAKLVSKI